MPSTGSGSGPGSGSAFAVASKRAIASLLASVVTGQAHGYFLPSQKVTRRKGGKVTVRRYRKWMHSEYSKPQQSSFWLLAFGFWLLAFGFWLLKVGFQIRFTFIRHGGAESPFRLYGDLLFDWAKSRQKPPLPSSGPYAALRGPLTPAPSGPARPTTCCASLHLAPSAAPKGCCAPWPSRRLRSAS